MYYFLDKMLLLLLLSHLIVSDSVRPHRQQPTRIPRPWDSPGKNTAVGFHFYCTLNRLHYCVSITFIYLFF